MLKFGNTYLNFTNKFLVNWVVPYETPESAEVTIGTQTWMNKNLDIDDGLGGITTVTQVIGNMTFKFTYYNGEAAIRIASSIQGWRLPTVQDINDLHEYVVLQDNKRTIDLRATVSWVEPGSDYYGFHFMGTGYYDNNSVLKQLANDSLFCTSDIDSNFGAHIFQGFDSRVITSNKNFKGIIRLIKE